MRGRTAVNAPGRWMGRAGCLCLVLVMIVGMSGAANAQSSHRAGLVVRFGDGRVITRCVTFTQDEISGLELLGRSGLSVMTQSSGIGAAICKIENQGCAADNCFCECKGDRCLYWSYWRLGQNGWVYAPAGAGITRVRPGDIDGWSWGADPPPTLPSLEEICQPSVRPSPTATATATATPTPTPSPTPTWTAAPTHQPAISATATATAAATATATATAAATATATATAAATATATATAAATATATATSTLITEPVRPPASSPIRYAIFGGIVVGLILLWAMLSRKK